MPLSDTPIVIADHSLVSANGRLGQPPRSTFAEVGRVLDQGLARAPENGLVIHFHGGLVSRDYALNTLVGNLGQTYRDAASHPLFFVWESSFTETLANNKQQLLSDPAFKELIKKVSEWAIKKISFDNTVKYRGNGGTEIDDIDQFRSEFDDFFSGQRAIPPTEAVDVDAPSVITTRTGGLSEQSLANEMWEGLSFDPGFKKALARAHAAAEANPPLATRGGGGGGANDGTVTVLSPEALEAMFPPEAGDEGDDKTRGGLVWLTVMRYVAKVVIAVIGRFRKGSEHGLYCTVVEEVLRSAYGNLFGATVWNAMKDDTRESFLDEQLCCGNAVLRHLIERQQDGQSFTQLTLVGHSTGAVYISHFLDSAKALGLQTPIKVAFLAPAITFERFAQTIRSHQSESLASFRMFAMTDNLERRDAMLTPIYISSLLYFVSGLLEGRVAGERFESVIDMPLLGMKRFHDGERYADMDDVRTVKNFLDAVAGRVVWSRQDGADAGMNSSAISHGGFDEDVPTRTSLVQFIRS